MAWGRGPVLHVGLAIVLAACGGGPVPPNPAVTTITWLASSITGGPDDPRQALIDAFQYANPTIRVELEAGSNNTDALRDELRTAIRDGTGDPDVFLGDVVWPAMFGHDGLALSISDHLPPAFWKRFPSTFVQSATYRGRTYAAPFFSDQGLLYYRKDLVPTPSTTWEQLVDEATALQRSGLVKYGFAWQGNAYEGLSCVWTELLSDAGGQVLDAGGTRSVMDSPQSLRALQFLRGLVTSGVAPPGVTTFQENQVTDAFDSLQVAFVRAWPATYANARSAGVLDKVGIAPLPTFDGSPLAGASTTGGWGLFINPHTRHLEAALAFIDWMTDMDAQDILAADYQLIAANSSVRMDQSVATRSPVLLAASRTRQVSRPANTPAYPGVSKAIYVNVNEALTGSRTPAQALQAADQQIDSALSSPAR
jgi:multiple sugar transport system substrate-binding protein